MLFSSLVAAASLLGAAAAPINLQHARDIARRDFSGYITNYATSNPAENAGLVNMGACGDSIYDSDYIAAVSENVYRSAGVDSRGRSNLCGKQVELTNTHTGATVVATIKDYCQWNAAYPQNCLDDALDVTRPVFDVLIRGESKDPGVFNSNIPGISEFRATWRFLDGGASNGQQGGEQGEQRPTTTSTKAEPTWTPEPQSTWTPEPTTTSTTTSTEPAWTPEPSTAEPTSTAEPSSASPSPSAEPSTTSETPSAPAESAASLAPSIISSPIASGTASALPTTTSAPPKQCRRKRPVRRVK